MRFDLWKILWQVGEVGTGVGEVGKGGAELEVQQV